MIVVIGDIAVDIVSTLSTPFARGSDAAASVRVMPGGSAANVAAWLARLGRAVTFVGRVGDDLFGRWLTEGLAAEGVSLSITIDPRRATGVIQVLVEPGGERSMIPDRGANAVWTGDEAPEALIAAAELVHVVGYVLLDAESQPGALRAMKIARAHGVPISLDPSSHAPLMALGADRFWSLVGDVDLILPNRHEARVLTGHADVEAAQSALKQHARTVVVKLDRDGCLASDGAVMIRVPAPGAIAINATGAGDAFNAAFLDRWLAGETLQSACRSAVALGSFATSLSTTR